jgi:hypothetical protein
MPWYIQLPVVFAYTAILWVAVLVLFNVLFEPFDFGPLGWFTVKSAILVLLVTLLVGFYPILGGLVSLAVWWIGLVVIFKKDLLECKGLVFLIWGTNFLFGLAIQAMLLSTSRSPVSTV